MELEGEPLDVREIRIEVKGVPRKVPALHPGFVEERHYLKFQKPNFKYKPITPEEWTEMMYIIIEDVNWLLRLPYHRFWSTVMYHTEIVTFLDSILSNMPRYYDTDDYEITDEMKSLMEILYEKTFKVYLRMSTYKESKTSHLTPQAFGQIIYNNYLFDIPKMMDLCALYGKANKDILSKMIKNIFTYQPLYFKDLGKVVTAYMQIFVDIQNSLGIAVSESLTEPQKLDCKKKFDKLSTMSNEDFTKLIMKVTDCCITLDNFFDIFKMASITLTLQSSLVLMAYFYTAVFPLLKKELHKKSRLEAELKKKLQKRLSQSKVSLVEAFRSMVYSACILPLEKASGPLQYPSEKEVTCIEEYINIIHSILSEKDFICDYQKKYPIEDDLELFMQHHYCPDTAQISFILNTLYSLYGKSIPNKFLEVNALLPSSSDNKESIVAGAAAAAPEIPHSSDMSDLEGACAQPRMEDVELDSLVSSIKDLFMDYGEGFIEECLHYYNYQVDVVINAILEDTLPPLLQTLDRTLKKSIPKSKSSAPELSFPDLVFDQADDIVRRPSPPPFEMKRNRNNSLSKEAKKEIVERYGMVDDKELYDDEYDDTYDSLPVAADTIQDEEDFVTPRVLQKPQKKMHQFGEDEEEDGESNQQQSRESLFPNHKQNNFARNPAEVRAEREARYQNRRGRGGGRGGGGRNHNVKGEPKGQGQTKEVQKDRRNKEAHKSKVGNHNRRDGFARKQRGGMF